jgi:hypothetical protein
MRYLVDNRLILEAVQTIRTYPTLLAHCFVNAVIWVAKVLQLGLLSGTTHKMLRI